jgi:CHRD domain
MRTRSIGLIAITGAAVLAIAAGAVATAGLSADVRAGASGYKEVPAISTAGDGAFTADIRSNAIHYRLRYGDLEGGDVLFAHIHLGRPSTNGGVIAFLCGGGDKPVCPASGTVTGVIDPADVVGPADQGIDAGEFQELVRAIRRNATYVNVHTDGYPNGEIRGNVVGA